MYRTGWGHFELDLWHSSYFIGCKNLVRVPECIVLDGVTLNLISGTSPILLAVRISNLVCGYILGVVECHTLFIDHCVSFMKIYCLWGYFINLWHNSWFCLIINSQTVQFKGIFIGGTTLFSHRRKESISTFSLSTQQPYGMIQGKTNSLTSQICKPLPYACTNFWASRYYFQHVFCTCEFNKQRWKHRNTKMYKGPSRSIIRIPQNFF